MNACTKCGATGVKLWRMSQDFSPEPTCVDCTCKAAGKDVASVAEDGTRPRSFGGRTDNIGWFVPAVPTPDGEGFWGYQSVPSDAAEAWRALPLRAPAVGNWMGALGSRGDIRDDADAMAAIDTLRELGYEPRDVFLAMRARGGGEL